ncbi:hypothetical protein GS636_17390 [Ruegeria sp. HKCCD4884]|uniref:hypothetical protein n=1 Tax=Ruegeria sp. HKCCD4884 TaxID=2683022 RepID=UPI001492B846|nr:hypothetical protein [Ruegeria sp. HKCCD4884]NOD94569.1 hypothetical protein [Ruegeria sp. HKCCD4884]
MMDTDILDMLEDIGRSSVARLSPAVTIAGESAAARRSAVLHAIRGTVLPRRLEFTASNGACLAIEVNSSRVTDVFQVPTGPKPDFETEGRGELVEKLAQLVSDIANAPAPLEMMSGKPDSDLEADDVGLTYSEIVGACAAIELSAEPIVSVVPDVEMLTEDEPLPAQMEDTETLLAQEFFDGARRFASGRVLIDSVEKTALSYADSCQPSEDMHPDQNVVARFAADLAGWDNDTRDEFDGPHLIVMRPSGGKGAGIAALSDTGQIAVAIHDARKLGAVVSLWTSLQGEKE